MKGSDIYLSINASAQYTADSLLASTIAPRGRYRHGQRRGGRGRRHGRAGRVGAGHGELPPPSIPRTSRVGSPKDIWDLYNTDESHAPLTNRVVNGQYAAASTYKAFTSMAGLHYGFATSASTWNCTGAWDGFGSGDVQKCWKLDGHGTLDLHGGIVNSCDVVFYEIAKAFYDHGPNGTGELSETALQEYLAKYHFGEATGVDVANESAGTYSHARMEG